MYYPKRNISIKGISYPYGKPVDSIPDGYEHKFDKVEDVEPKEAKPKKAKVKKEKK